MSRASIPSPVALALALFPACAWANSGIGFLLVSVPAVLLALVPAIFIEAPVLAAILHLPLRRGLVLSAGANIRSTLIGILIALAVDFTMMGIGGGSGLPPHRASLVFSLLPMFFITWWIEHRAVAGKLPDSPRQRVSLAVFVANAVSYVALVAVIALTPLFTFYDQMGYRERLYFAQRVTQPWQRKVEEYWTRHKRLPERAADIGIDEGVAPPRDIGAVTLNAGGSIVVELRFPGEPDLDRKRLILSPQIDGDKIADWHCRAPDIPARYVPHPCRN